MTIDELHYLSVGDDGSYSQSGDYQSDADQLSRIIAYLKEKDVNELTLYFHGGLVNEDSAVPGIKNVMSAVPNRDAGQAEVLSFIWKTGLFETIWDNLDEIFKSKFGKSLLKWVVRAVSKKLKVDFTKSAVNDGLSLEQIEEELEKSATERRAPFGGLQVEFASRAKGPGITSLDEDDPELIMTVTAELEQRYQFDSDKLADDWDELPEHVVANAEIEDFFREKPNGRKGIISLGSLAKAITKVSVRVIRRYLKDRDHGLQATVVEEICRGYFVSDAGQWIWGSMKDKAAEMWRQNGRVGYDLMAALNQEMPELKLHLVGHSAGSVAICELLRKHREQGWSAPVDKVLWWAPACRADLFLAQVIEQPAGFGEFRMVTMSDDYERGDALVNALPWLYPSSLLYFISGVLEEKADAPLAGMERYHQEKEPYTGELFAAIEEFLQGEGRLVLSKTAPDAPEGFRSDAIDHGAFNEDPETLKSLTSYLG